MLMNRFLSRLTGSAPTVVDASGLLSGISYHRHHHLTLQQPNFCVTVLFQFNSTNSQIIFKCTMN